MGTNFKNIKNSYLTCSAGEGGGRVVQGGAGDILGEGDQATVQSARAKNLKSWLIVGGSRSEKKASISADGKTGSGEKVL